MESIDGRVLWRETKRIRRLRRYESLPVAHLVPEHRPLYVCQECKFSNPLIEVCPWCRHRCTAVSAGESSVRKRTSAPQMLNERQKDQLQRIKNTAHEKKPALEATVAAFDISLPQCIPEDDDTRPGRRRHRHAMAYTIALSMDEDETDDDDMEGPNNYPAIIDQSHASTNKSRLGRSNTVKSAPPKSPPSPTKTLRRKKRMSVIRQRSSCSLRRKAMLSLPNTFSPKRTSGDEAMPSLPRKTSRTKVQPPSLTTLPPLPPSLTTPAEPNVPLGHPSRPLYSAIRKNMSRPSTPNGTPRLAPPVDLRSRGMRSLDLPDSSREALIDDYFSPTISRRPWPVRPNSAGYSLSGEIELRLALARGDFDDPADAPVQSDAKLVDKKGRGEVGLGNKVRRLGKGLKDLMMMRI